MEYLGVPPKNIILSAKKRNLFFDDELNPIKKENSKGKVRHPNTKKFEEFMDGADEAFIDLLKVIFNLIQKCFNWNPFKRIKPDEALKHKFFANFKKSFVIKKENTQKIINVADNKKSNFLKYKVQINKLSNQKYEQYKTKQTKVNSNFSKEESFANNTKQICLANM